MSVPIFSPNETGEQVNEVRLLSLEAAKKLGLSLPIESYDPSKHHPLCKSGRDLEKSLHPVIPGMAHAIANQTAAVERYAVQANDAKDAAYEELTGNIKSHLALAVLIHERQPEYLRRLEALEQERSPKREVFAQNAAHLEIALDPKTISVASVTEALRGEEDYGSRTVPIPGAPSRAGVVGLALTKVFAPLFLGIPIGLALVTLTGMIPIATLQNLPSWSR